MKALFVSFVAWLLLAVTAHAGQFDGSPSKLKLPAIRNVKVDHAAGTMTIEGAYFGTNPRVEIDYHPVTVYGATPSVIVAELPAAMAPGTYVVTVQTVSGFFNISLTASFVVAVGAQGPAGPAGAEGAPGAQGPAGEPGPQGPEGPQGAVGPKGPEGSQGAAGPQGPEGPQGAVGPQGPEGPQGAAGPQGPEGPQGAAGPQGPEGLKGAAGPQGPEGPQGAAGPQGPEGPKGSDGPQGPAGPQGAQGPQGPEGPKGSDGPQGPAGPQGAQGQHGPAGPTGPEGPSAIIGSVFAAEPAPGPTPGNLVVTFLSPAVSVTITKLGQRVLVNATRAFGSTLATGANGLSLYICWAGVSIAAPNAPVMDGLSVGPNQRIPFSLSAVVPNLPPGTYLVGLCGFALTPSAWNNNGVGYTTAIVF